MVVEKKDQGHKNTKKRKQLHGRDEGPAVKSDNFEFEEQNLRSVIKREGRLRAKELTVARKKQRKRHYTLEQELASLWEKMRRRNIAKEDRSSLVSEALQEMKGKISEIAGSHISSRVLQTCVKYCSQAERDVVFEELRPNFLTLACNTYAVHLVKKMLDNASKKQLAGFISSLHGHVAALLRHMVGSVVVEHSYQLGNSTQKLELLAELYSSEFQLFKDSISSRNNSVRLLDLISILSLQKGSVLRHMASVIQPIMEKGIVDHSIIHRALLEYLTIADQTSASDMIQQLSGPLLVRMIHTRDGSKLGILCVKHGNTKARKKIIKGTKGHVGKIAHDQCGNLMLVCILSVVDDTKLITKVIIRELQNNLKDLILDKNGRLVLLQLLNPNCSRYFNPNDLATLNLFIASLCTKDGLHTKAKADDSSNKETNRAPSDVGVSAADGSSDLEAGDDHIMVEGGKKDPNLRRQELLLDSGLAKSLFDTCIESAEEFLRSNFGKEVLYEVATGGSDGILHPTFDDQINALHEAIATLAAQPKSAELEQEHVLENFHSSRTIRKLVLDCSNFACTLWEMALKGNCKMWAEGHSKKVVCAFLESSDPKVRKLASEELRPLIDTGILKTPDLMAAR